MSRHSFVFSLSIFFSAVAVVVLFSDMLSAHDGRADARVIHITAEGFEPRSLVIVQGNAVLFENTDVDAHWPASNLHPTHTLYPGSDIRKCGTDAEHEVFDACRPLREGEEYSFVFNRSGTWRYHDHGNPELKGEIVVEADPYFRLSGTKPTEAKDGMLKRLARTAKAFFHRTYFSFFSSQKEKKLSNLDFYTVAYSDETLAYWLRVLGEEAVIEDLARDSFLEDENGNEVSNCHLPAHLVGRMAYRIFEKGPFSETIDHRCQFGFFHGAIEEYFEEEDAIDDETIIDMYRRCASVFKDSFRRGGCEHGIGHGLMVYYDYDLSAAVERCKVTNDRKAQTMCFHGAFMENAFVALGFAADHASEWVDEARPDFPCTYFEEDIVVRRTCYFNQSFLWGRPLEDFNVWSAVEGCLRASENVRHDCFMGFGFGYAFPPLFRDNDTVLHTCGTLGETYFHDCVAGVVLVRATTWEGFEYEKEKETFCRLLDKENIEGCKKTFDERLLFIYDRN